MTRDWTRHELRILVAHHTAMAREFMDTVAMLRDEDDNDVSLAFSHFANLRMARAEELIAQLDKLG